MRQRISPAAAARNTSAFTGTGRSTAHYDAVSARSIARVPPGAHTLWLRPNAVRPQKSRYFGHARLRSFRRFPTEPVERRPVPPGPAFGPPRQPHPGDISHCVLARVEHRVYAETCSSEICLRYTTRAAPPYCTSELHGCTAPLPQRLVLRTPLQQAFPVPRVSPLQAGSQKKSSGRSRVAPSHCK